jgi:HlyD family secretion protein
MSENTLTRKMIFTVIPVFIIAGMVVYTGQKIIGKKLPEGLIQANGRIEGENHVAASKISGKIIKIFADEGDSVKAGQILAELDDSQIKAKAEQASAAVSAARAKLEASETALELLKKEIPLSVEKAKAGVAHARAVQAKAAAAERQASRDAVRFKKLAEEGTVGKQKGEQADLAWKSAAADLDTAGSGLVQAEKMLEDALLGKSRIKAREGELAAVSAQAAQAEAALREVESIVADLAVKAPADGVITTKISNPGEVIAQGSPIFSIVDPDSLFLKVYVPEKEIGRLRKGIKAKIYIDSMPDKPFDGTVTFISSKAEFTPKEVQTPDERVKLVYAVKISLDSNPEHAVTPGIPADAVIRWKDGAEWAKPGW